MLPYLPPLPSGAEAPTLVVSCKRELFAKLQATSQRHFILEALGGFIDQDGYTTLAYDLRKTNVAAAFATAIHFAAGGQRIRQMMQAKGGDE